MYSKPYLPILLTVCNNISTVDSLYLDYPSFMWVSSYFSLFTFNTPCFQYIHISNKYFGSWQIFLSLSRTFPPRALLQHKIQLKRLISEIQMLHLM